MKRPIPRIPKFYRGNQPTGRKLCDLLPKALDEIASVYAKQGSQVLSQWPEIIGERFAPMTKACAFENGILKVKVTHPALYSVLVEYEKPRLEACLRQRFPNIKIHKIHFQVG